MTIISLLFACYRNPVTDKEGFEGISWPRQMG
jgi:hypothetical protein